MKTAISLPDELFEAMDRAARALGVSRSELFARAAAAYLERSDDEIRKSYDAAFSESDEDAELRREAARAALAQVEW